MQISAQGMKNVAIKSSQGVISVIAIPFILCGVGSYCVIKSLNRQPASISTRKSVRGMYRKGEFNHNGIATQFESLKDCY